MRSPAILASLLLVGSAPAMGAADPPAAPAVEVVALPSMDLASVVFHLAKIPGYEGKKSPWLDDVEDAFEARASHRAVDAARLLRATRGISYDAVPSLAVHLDADLGVRVPLDAASGLDARWTEAHATEFVEELRRFRTDAGFEAFWAAHQETLDQARDALGTLLTGRDPTPWLAEILGGPLADRIVAAPALLASPHAYGATVLLPGGGREVWALVGADRWSRGRPVFGDQALLVLVHELTHGWANPYVERHADVLRPPGERLLAVTADAMDRHAYGRWDIVVTETLVRAVTRRWAAAEGGEALVALATEMDLGQGFSWIGGLASEMPPGPELDGWAPALASHLGAVADTVPRVASFDPPDGAPGVDPARRDLRVTFDRPMHTGSFSVCGDPAKVPAMPEDAHWEKGGRTLHLPVRLEPGRTYEIGLNSERFHRFRSADGLTLAPVVWTFTTAPAP